MLSCRIRIRLCPCHKNKEIKRLTLCKVKISMSIIVSGKAVFLM